MRNTREQSVRKCIRMARKHLDLMGHGDLDLPNIEVVTRTGADWAGLHTYRYNYARATGHSTIFIQRYVADGGDYSLERIVAHEMIHFVLFATLSFEVAKRITHGREFLAYRDTLNAVLGDDFVQVRCDKDFERGSLRSPIHVVLWRKAGQDPTIAWFKRTTPKVQRILQRLAVHPNSEARVTQSCNVEWSAFPKLATCRFSFAKAHLEEPAKQLWEKGVPLAKVTP